MIKEVMKFAVILILAIAIKNIIRGFLPEKFSAYLA